MKTRDDLTDITFETFKAQKEWLELYAKDNSYEDLDELIRDCIRTFMMKVPLHRDRYSTKQYIVKYCKEKGLNRTEEEINEIVEEVMKT